MAILTSMSRPSLQDYVCQQGDSLADYPILFGRVRTLVKNRNAMQPQGKQISEVKAEDSRIEEEIAAVGPQTKCYNCEGCGHLSHNYPKGGPQGRGEDPKGSPKGYP